MPFELIMLLGFFGAGLLSLLPAAPARTAGESFRGRPRQRRDHGGNTGTSRRNGALTGRDDAIRPRRAGRAAV